MRCCTPHSSWRWGDCSKTSRHMSAKDARAVVRAARVASLATVGPAGEPLATLVAVTDDGHGNPLFLVSALAEHTRNLRSNPMASVLIAAGEGPSLDRTRVTLSGAVTWLAADEAQAAKARFVSTHPEAAVWVTLADFAPARLEPASIRYVGGF